MNRYYVEVEHPVSNNIVYLYMFAYDSKQIKEHKIIEAIKDGIADGLLHGERDDTKSHHYYKIGYDYGCVMFDMLGTDVCRTKINDKEIA